MMCGISAQRPPEAKFALLGAESASIPGLMRALSRELAPIRVSAIMAGVVDTVIHHDNRAELAQMGRAAPSCASLR